MPSRLITFSFLLIFLILPHQSHAQTYVHEGSIGNLPAKDTLVARRDDAVPLGDWLGKRFVILPKPNDLQSCGYSTLRRPQGGFIIPSYDECAGQVATVADLYDDGSSDRRLNLQLNDGRKYTAVSSSGEFPEIAPASDIDDARAKWEGKTIWLFSGPLYEYDARTGKLYSFEARSSEPVKVKEVTAGWDHNYPIRMIVETQDGLEGFFDVQWSSTNVSDVCQGHGRAGTRFLDHDPHSY